MKKYLIAFALSVMFSVPGIQVAAAEYPDRPVKIIVPYPVGGPTDISARMIAQKLSQSLGRPFVVDNVPGAGGNIGTAAVAKSPADGYTLLVAGGAFVINTTLYPNPGYDTRNFAQIALLAIAPMILLVHPSVPATNVGELISLVKSRPGKMSYGSSSIGGAPHLAMELLKTKTGMDLIHVPYRGAAPALNDLAGGHVSIVLDSMVTGLQFSKGGKARALAVTGAQRSTMAPEIPTVAESGVPGFEASVWYGFFAPAGTPQPILQLLNSEINKALKMPDVHQRLIDFGTDPASTSMDEFNRFIDTEVVKWGAIVKASGAKAE